MFYLWQHPLGQHLSADTVAPTTSQPATVAQVEALQQQLDAMQRRLDAAQQQALVNFDVPTRKAAYSRIEGMLTRDQPQIVLWWPRQIQPINPDFKNFTPNPVTASWNAYQWEI